MFKKIEDPKVNQIWKDEFNDLNLITSLKYNNNKSKNNILFDLYNKDINGKIIFNHKSYIESKFFNYYKSRYNFKLIGFLGITHEIKKRELIEIKRKKDLENKIEEKDINKIIGLKIKNKRKELNLNQQNLAIFLGITFQQIQKYEKGISKINIEKLYKLMSILKVNSLDYFIKKGDNND